MKPVFVLYATREGQTRRIAEHVAARLRERGRVVMLHDVQELPGELDLAAGAAAVLAAPIHVGKHAPAMVAFVKKHLERLRSLPTVFLSVSMSAAGVHDENRSESQRAAARREVDSHITRFTAETGWQPDAVQPVAGALLYRQYGLIVRFVMRLIVGRAGGPTDTSRDYEFTDWRALDGWVDRFVEEHRAHT